MQSSRGSGRKESSVLVVISCASFMITSCWQALPPESDRPPPHHQLLLLSFLTTQSSSQFISTCGESLHSPCHRMSLEFKVDEHLAEGVVKAKEESFPSIRLPDCINLPDGFGFPTSLFSIPPCYRVSFSGIRDLRLSLISPSVAALSEICSRTTRYDGRQD